MPLPLIALPIAAAAASSGTSTGTVAFVLSILGLGGGGYFFYRSNNSKKDESRTESLKKQAEMVQEHHDDAKDILNDARTKSEQVVESIQIQSMEIPVLDNAKEQLGELESQQALLDFVDRQTEESRLLKIALAAQLQLSTQLEQQLETTNQENVKLNELVSAQQHKIEVLESQIKKAIVQLSFFKSQASMQQEMQTAETSLTLDNSLHN